MESYVFFTLLCVAVLAMVRGQTMRANNYEKYDRHVDGGNPYVDGGNPYADGGNPYVDGGNPYVDGGSSYVDGGEPYPGDHHIGIRDGYVREDLAYERYPADHVGHDYVRRYGNSFKDPYERDIRKYRAGYQYGLTPEDIEFIIREKAIPSNMHIVGKYYGQ